MKYNVELGANIKFTDEDGTHTFTEGDNVICCLGDEERYVGKITCIGNYQENEDSEPEQAICIDTSKSKTSYSSEIIKTADITYICKNPLADTIKPTMTKEEQDKRAFVGMLTGLGYEEKGVEIVYEKMKKVIDLYSIPISKAMACAIYAINNQCSITIPLKEMCGIDIGEAEKTVDILMETAKECSAMAVKAFAELIDIFKEAVASGETDIPTFGEILDLVAENWSGLVDEDKEKVTKILAGVKDTAAK